MRNLVAVVLMICCLVSSVSAQTPLVPERELLALQDSVFADDNHPDTVKMKCGEYFLYAGADSQVPLITFNVKPLPSDERGAVLLIVMQKRNVQVVIDNTKKIPTTKIIPGPQMILRISRVDYEKSSRCLPKPPSA